MKLYANCKLILFTLTIYSQIVGIIPVLQNRLTNLRENSVMYVVIGENMLVKIVELVIAQKGVRLYILKQGVWKYMPKSWPFAYY